MVIGAPLYLPGFHYEECNSAGPGSSSPTALAAANTEHVRACARLCEASDACAGLQWQDGRCVLHRLASAGPPQCDGAVVGATYYSRNRARSQLVAAPSEAFVLAAAGNSLGTSDAAAACALDACLTSLVAEVSRAGGEALSTFRQRCLSACDAPDSQASVAFLDRDGSTCRCGTATYCDLTATTICAAAVYARRSALAWASLAALEAQPDATALVELWSPGSGLIFSTLGDPEATELELARVPSVAACEVACTSITGCTGIIFQRSNSTSGTCVVLNALGQPRFVGKEATTNMRFLLRYAVQLPQRARAREIAAMVDLVSTEGEALAFGPVTAAGRSLAAAQATSAPGLVFTLRIDAGHPGALTECARVCGILSPTCKVFHWAREGKGMRGA